MSRLAQRFAALRAQGRTALVPYIMAGDPSPEATVELMHAMVAAGADVIELGMPFSDPIADGPVIQQAAERALAAGMSVTGLLDVTARFRERDRDTPVVVMGYLNPIERLGYERFVAAVGRAGVDGLLTVDLPPEEGDTIVPLLREQGIDPIFLVSPTTTAARIRMLCGQASGFVYYVSLKGVTGGGGLDVDAVAERLAPIRAETQLPVGVGFGIRDAETAGRVGRIADAVVVGSALVQRVEEARGDSQRAIAAVSELLSAMRAALDADGATPAGADERRQQGAKP